MGNKARDLDARREAFLLQRVLLKLGDPDEDLVAELSAVAHTPDGSLWVGSDQLRSVEKLTMESPGVYGSRERYALDDLIGLDGSGDEVDIEGMDFADGYLWLTGSHSLTRDDGDDDDDDEDRIDALEALEREDNRFLLARVPIVEGEPFRAAERGEGARRAAATRITDDGAGIVGALRDDPHIGPALDRPAKENGFDIEGLAVRDGRVYLGLRGPVLGAWAVILELRVEERAPGVLGLVESDTGRRYYKHFVKLAGLGIRELCFYDDDLLVLAGPTMDHEGAMKVFRLAGGPGTSGDTITPLGEGLELLFDLPITIGGDHAEGLALFPGFEEEQGLLIVYDDPKEERLRTRSAVYADVYRL